MQSFGNDFLKEVSDGELKYTTESHFYGQI